MDTVTARTSVHARRPHRTPARTPHRAASRLDAPPTSRLGDRPSPTASHLGDRPSPTAVDHQAEERRRQADQAELISNIIKAQHEQSASVINHLEISGASNLIAGLAANFA